MSLIELIRWRRAKKTAAGEALATFSFPALSDLEAAVARAEGPEAKPRLLELADRGKRFHSAVSLFIGNYTFLAAGHFQDALEYDRKELIMFGLRQLQGRRPSLPLADGMEWDIVRGWAADDLHNILETAEQGGYLDQACDVIGYLKYSASHVQSIFHSFGFFYEHSTREPQHALAGVSRRENMGELGFRARQSLAAMPETAMDDLVLWVGQHGYEGMRGMTSTTYHFKDNRPDTVVTTSLVPELPALPTKRKTDFYRRFGEALLRCYDAMPERQARTLVKCA